MQLKKKRQINVAKCRIERNGIWVGQETGGGVEAIGNTEVNS